MLQPQIKNIFDWLLEEYRQVGEFYRHIYAILWQVTAAFFTALLIIFGWMIQMKAEKFSWHIYLLLTLAICLWLAFTFILNSYGGIMEKRGIEIEKNLIATGGSLFHTYAKRHEKGLMKILSIRLVLAILGIGMIGIIWLGKAGWIK
jgi:glucan phosphoethanolaminetransferase (alkaline phosphatase superfamily)